MPASFNLQIQVGDVTHVITLIELAVDDASELMRDVLLVMIRSTQQTFEAQGRPARWADLAESTVLKRLRRAMRLQRVRDLGSLGAVGSIQILRDTGLLMQSVGAGASGSFSAADGFGDSDAFTAVIGTNRPGWQNQFPDSRGWRPERPFLVFQDQDEEDIADMAMHWLMRTGPYAEA